MSWLGMAQKHTLAVLCCAVLCCVMLCHVQELHVVFAGDSEGRVHVLDPRTQEPVNVLQVNKLNYTTKMGSSSRRQAGSAALSLSGHAQHSLCAGSSSVVCVLLCVTAAPQAWWQGDVCGNEPSRGGEGGAHSR